ncbi:MAG: phenylalanine--tRNA ligase subunit alpha [Candidatus Pacearchaeota archaeon]|nr:MAG: phenylalanine--tRNA ligase subunit alpha [Candidatus Pacearchaeota archaeon]
MNKKEVDLEDLLLSLSPLERTILPLLHLSSVDKISEQGKLDMISLNRAFQFLGNKNLIKLSKEKRKFVKIDTNGILYLKKGLPERRLLSLLFDIKKIGLGDAKKRSGLSDNEFAIALGVLKEKKFVEVITGSINLKVSKEEATKKFPEEKFLESLPLELEKLNEKEKNIFQKLKTRKDLVRIDEISKISFEITELGKKVIDELPKFKKELIEQLSSDMIKKGTWRGKVFRKYDIKSRAPEIYGGKRHFVNQAIDYARKIWIEMGFKEMTGTLAQVSFWNFDALFTAQDHPVREMHDTFYVQELKGKLPDKKIVKAVKGAHEKGVHGSKGWKYEWKEDEAKKIILRTHTTCLSAKTLAILGKLKDKKNKRGKFFAVGKCFRNETLDWSHGFEFYQTEGIVLDKNANFRHLLGYLQEFYKKMGFNKIRFAPAYFPYTEPSMEITVWHPEKKVWLELGGAGIFRPEVTIPLLGEFIPVLAWGPGFDRAIMDYYQIKDLREMYKNDINQLRKIKFWLK